MSRILKQHDEETLFLSYHGENGFHYPYIDDRIENMSRNGPFDKWLLEKYSGGDLQILPTDTVIDCGAFIGAFSIAAYKKNVQRIFSIEPSSRNFKCLNLNIRHYKAEDKITSVNIGLGNKCAKLKLNLSELSCENSFLKCDQGATGKTEMVDVKTLDVFIKENDIDVDNLYLKVEAEGFEPEIIQGLGDNRPRVIAVDVTAERNMESPRVEIENQLKQWGYETYNTQRCLFGLKDE